MLLVLIIATTLTNWETIKVTVMASTKVLKNPILQSTVLPDELLFVVDFSMDYCKDGGYISSLEDIGSYKEVFQIYLQI